MITHSTPYLTQVDVLQFEISTNCNLFCKGCIRTNKFEFGKSVNPLLPEKNQFLNPNIVEQILSSDACQKLKEIQFCGTIDDPLTHPQLLEILDIIYKRPDIKIQLHTNASLRTPNYFREIAKRMGPRSEIMFSIDGLENTNHLYRIGADWNKIISNAEAFIDAGGTAVWQYIEFPWNEQDTEEAELLAKKMGFERFKWRRDRSGSPTDEEIPGQIEFYKKIYNKSWEEYLDGPKMKTTEPIECFSKGDKMFFIGYNGEVWPCCFLHNGKWLKDGTFSQYQERFEGNYGKNWNNLYYHSFDEIYNHKFYQDDLTASWSSKNHGTGCKDRITRCTATCSKKNFQSRPIGSFPSKTF
jgi:MoaA/NifB/PqqE/SkfB family radical SAM enzyme